MAWTRKSSPPQRAFKFRKEGDARRPRHVGHVAGQDDVRAELFGEGADPVCRAHRPGRRRPARHPRSPTALRDAPGNGLVVGQPHDQAAISPPSSRPNIAVPSLVPDTLPVAVASTAIAKVHQVRQVCALMQGCPGAGAPARGPRGDEDMERTGIFAGDEPVSAGTELAFGGGLSRKLPTRTRSRWRPWTRMACRMYAWSS